MQNTHHVQTISNPRPAIFTRATILVLRVDRQETSRFSLFQHARCSEVRRGRMQGFVSRHKCLGIGIVDQPICCSCTYKLCTSFGGSHYHPGEPFAGRESTARICASGLDREDLRIWIGSRRLSDREHNNQTDSHSEVISS
jgi:hypothetical protein